MATQSGSIAVVILGMRGAIGSGMRKEEESTVILGFPKPVCFLIGPAHNNKGSKWELGWDMGLNNDRHGFEQ